MCEALLSEKNRTVLTKETEMTKADLKTIIFVLQYMLSRLSISIANKPEYCNKLLGAKVSGESSQCRHFGYDTSCNVLCAQMYIVMA